VLILKYKSRCCVRQVETHCTARHVSGTRGVARILTKADMNQNVE